jgi:carboxyl-terminal processing protease
MSASASEIFAGAVQDYNRGIVLGGQTFGKGTVQSLFPLSKGQLKATTAKYYRVSGQSTQNKGVVPDMEYPSIFNPEDMGESSLPEALEWDKIRPIPYQKYYKLASVIPILKEKHIYRSKPTQDYQYLLDRKARNKELRERKTVYLSEEKRRKELEEAEQWRLKLENALRLSKGKPLLEKLSDLDEDEALGGHSSKINVDDPLLVEASEVMIDFIEALGKNLATL